MTNFKERLKEYLEIEQIYQDYKKGKEPTHNDGCSDFEWFCIEHCKDIENLLEEAEELQEESYKLSELWCKSAEENKELLNKIDKAIEYIEENKMKGKYSHSAGEYDNFILLEESEINDVLEILKGENND